MAEAAGLLYGVETMVEGAIAAAKGIYDPTLPLKATVVPITGIDLERIHHTVSVIKGRAYIFGGQMQGEGGGRIADNDMHIIILPSSGLESTDYKRIPGGPDAPPPRCSHSAAVIDNQIYIYGGEGENDESLSDEKGTVWAFDTVSSRWSRLQPQSERESVGLRFCHAATATEHPRATIKPTNQDTMPQAAPDPARDDMVPEPEAAYSYGTMIIYGGISRDGESNPNATFSFDIASRTWNELPSLSGTGDTQQGTPSLAIVENRLYTMQAGQTYYMDLATSTFSDKSGGGSAGLSALGPWTAMQGAGDPDVTGPGQRSCPELIPVTTGQGRNYLLAISGFISGSRTPQSEIWSQQLKPEGMTAASFKDAARMAIKKDTGEQEWAEVKYYDAEGVMVQEGQAGRGVGQRVGFAAAKGTDMDGSSVLIWGGLDKNGNMFGDGLMVTVTR